MSVKNRWLAGVLTFSLSLTAFAGAQKNQKEGEKKTMGNAVAVDPRLLAANTKFGFRLYSELVKKDAGKNIFVSPTSVAIALAMTYNGAEGATRQAMERALELQGVSREEINQAYAQLKTMLENLDPKVQLQIANSLWARQGVSFTSDFIDRSKRSFAAEVRQLNFNSPSAPATINAWVSDKTKGKIDKIVDQINSDTVMFLINAIYFKGMWTKKFDAAETVEDAFTLASGAKKQQPMMNQRGKYSYFENDKLQAVSLPYGDKRVQMYVFLPKESSSLGEFHAALTADNWTQWMSQFKMTEGHIALPRFKVEYEASLLGALGALGMGPAFGRDADFSAMVKPPAKAFIGEVKHKAFAEVNEEGTEAAAVTSVEMRTTSLGPPQRTFEMLVNRPFFFAIRDNQTGSVLFMGSITEPR